ncbi:MAG: hypothetical protein RLY30_1901 [Pseudomonadota bacterium]|jgi:hypothetical protein
MFQKNMGSIDRILRIIIGIALVAAAATGTLGAWAFIGVVPIVTAALGSCPAYSLIGLRTCSAPNQESQS